MTEVLVGCAPLASGQVPYGPMQRSTTSGTSTRASWSATASP